jgi:hypothetical protein
VVLRAKSVAITHLEVITVTIPLAAHLFLAYKIVQSGEKRREASRKMQSRVSIGY